jgi:WD40 repeat protein
MLVLNGRRNGGDLLAFAPDGHTLVVRCEAGLQIWRELKDGAKPQVVKGISAGWFQFAPDGERLHLDGSTAGIFDLRTCELTPFPRAEGGQRFLALSPDGHRVVAAHWLNGNRPCRIDCWPAERVGTGRPLWSVTSPRDGCLRPRFLSDDRFALPESPAAPRFTQRTYCHVIRSVKNGSVLDESPTFDFYPDWDATSPDGKWIAGAMERRIHVWSVADFRSPPIEWENDTRSSFTDIVFHPSGKYLAATSNDKTVKFYDTTTWKLAKTFTWDIGKMRSIAFPPDGTLAAAGSDKGKVIVWDVDL